MQDIESEYQAWADALSETERAELAVQCDTADQKTDAFYRELAFGTAGLRGIIGLGPNRMNVYTVGKATQGLANYLNTHFSNASVAIARDSRNKGEQFVQAAAGVLAANGIHAFVYPRIAPTPALSFAVRDLGCQAGINVTASHNPSEYNGYKVYGPDGCQIASAAAEEIQHSIDGLNTFADVKTMGFDEGMQEGLISWIGEDTLDRFIDAVAAQSLEDSSQQAEKLRLVYTPLNGTGLECVSRILERVGISDINLVDEQAVPDGDFPTCPYPNPETAEALKLGLEYCRRIDADLLLATDPDADRVGIAVRHNGEYVLLTGNEVGVLLLEYICEMRKAAGEDLSRAVAITTIVSSAMSAAQAQEYGFQLRRVLTGFKWIGGQIALLEAAGEASRFIFGFEESYGYMSGSHVRDKDAINASMLICQAAKHYKALGRDLVEVMDDLYKKYGYYLNKTISINYPGAAGAATMQAIMGRLHSGTVDVLAGRPVVDHVDYAGGAELPVINLGSDAAQQLPNADVVEYQLEGECKVLIRPSGTEPKIKAYLFAKGETREQAQAIIDELEAAAREMLQ